MPDRSPSAPRKRSYHSPARQRQAEETRQRIQVAARALLSQRGYAGTTLDAIAEEAGVSPKTVASVFGSKIGILAEVLNPAAIGSRFQQIIADLRADPDPYRRAALVAHLARRVYEMSPAEFELLRGAEAVAPELAAIAQNIEERRWHHQERFVAYLCETGVLRPDVSQTYAVDVTWALASFDLYRALVRQRRWPPERYEAWLTQALIGQLFKTAEDAR